MFVFGLLLILVSAQQCAVPNPRVDCGQVNLTASQCLERQCCWDNSTDTQPACYFPGGSGVPITTVHMVFACHLDVGFLNTSAQVVNWYFDDYFMKAAAIGKALRLRGGPERLIWMTHTFLISLFFDCPPGYGIHCPNETNIEIVKEAILAGDITWHAFPFNSQIEMHDAIQLKFGISLSHSLDAMFGLPPKSTMSHRDIPGLTRSAIPYLKSLGVNALSVGVNEISTAPNVPRAFRWREPTTNETLVAMWHPRGYGGITVADAVIVPGFDRALVFAWDNDNSGPPSYEEVLDDFAQVRSEFPGASVIASTFDMYTSQLLAYQDNLPLIDKEIGDTWIYGPPSDPIKIAKIRAVHRSVYNCQQIQNLSTCQNSNYNFWNFSRLALKQGEHTWGEDVPIWLNDTGNWTNTDFNNVRTATNYQNIIYSWTEQMKWCFDYPLEALPSNDPLRQRILQEFAAITPHPPNLSGYTSVNINGPLNFKTSRFSIGFNSTTGAITQLVDANTSQSWATPTSPLALLQYTTYDQDDYDAFQNDYCDETPCPDWFSPEYEKPGMNSTHFDANATLIAFWQKGQSGEIEASYVLQYLVQLARGNNTLNTDYGGPALVWLQINVTTTGLNLTLNFVNKTSTRFSEAMYFRMVPPVADSQRVWGLDKLGYWINPLDVQPGGAQVLHAVSHKGVRVGNQASTMYINTLDASVVSVGWPNAFPIPQEVSPNVNLGTAFVLWTNTWGTNWIMWWPYENDAKMGNLQYRFSITFQ